MTEVTLAEAQAGLPALIAGLPVGSTVVITDAGRTVATITVPPPGVRPGYGAGKGKIRIIRDDDSHLDDFAGHL